MDLDRTGLDFGGESSPTRKFRGAPQSMFETMDHELHRKGRMALNPFFSKRSVQSLEPVIREKVGELLARLRKTLNTKLVVDLSTAYAALIVACSESAPIVRKRMVGGLHG